MKYFFQKRAGIASVQLYKFHTEIPWLLVFKHGLHVKTFLFLSLKWVQLHVRVCSKIKIKLEYFNKKTMVRVRKAFISQLSSNVVSADLLQCSVLLEDGGKLIFEDGPDDPVPSSS